MGMKLPLSRWHTEIRKARLFNLRRGDKVMKPKRKLHTEGAPHPNVDTAGTGGSDVIENQADIGGRRMQREQSEYHAVSPVLAGGDVDANWQGAEDSGEETPGGHAPTPDQDEVDEIGRAYGMELPDDQELLTHDELLGKRDAHRWELDRRSAEEHGEDVEI
jgi:hypothetical protein